MTVASDNHNQPTALLTLGRLPVALELARALHGAGWRVIVAEPFAWHLCRLSNTVAKSFKVTAPVIDSAAYLSQLADIVCTENVSLVLPVSEEVLFVSALREQVGSSVTVACMDQNVMLSLHDKYLFNQMARAMNLPVPATALASARDALQPLLANSYVLKPRLSCAGAGVSINAAGAAFRPPEDSDAFIVQSALTGPECCTFSIAHEGKILVSVCYRSLLDAGSVSVCFEQMPLPDEVALFIDSVVAGTAYSGMISFDFMRDANGIWQAIECNPRATSGLHFLSPQAVIDSLPGAWKPVAVNAGERADRRQEFWSCLLELEAALFKGRLNRQGWSRLFNTRDINWRWRDMKPFLLMSFIMAPQLIKAMRKGRPVSQLLMEDVGWHER